MRSTPSAARRSPNGSLSPVGCAADAEQAGQRLELVGERDRLRDGALGQRVAGEAWRVVLRDRVRDAVRLAVVQRVVASHQSLQLGKLADHVGDEIGLGEPRGAVGERGVGADRRGDPPRERADALHPLALRAELVVVDDGVEAGQPRLELRLAVLVVEEPRVGEPGAQHALVAADDRGGILGGEVRHDEEAGLEPSRRVDQREVLLVLLHRQDQALLRHGEERAVERAGVDDRPLDQRGHLVQQRVGHDHRRPLRGPGERLLRSRRGASRTRRSPCPRPRASTRSRRRSRSRGRRGRGSGGRRCGCRRRGRAR